MRNNKFEILAPAGSFETFKAVIRAGADAVYVGGSAFGARAYADNFSQEELLEAIDYAHLRNVKVYLTVNTLLKNDEIKNQLITYLKPFYEQGLDAVLVQDFGALNLIHKVFPDMPIHTSTQMTVTGVEGVKFLQNYGVTRVVMAREVSLAEMKKIHDETGMELEAFVHGALCYCYSGQCLFSSMLGGRSGNRGRCAQPCRLPYTVDKDNTYILSLKDMCGVENIAALEEAGVYSLKIEGRMKKASYAAGVVALYRKAVDTGSLTDKDMQHIMELGNRCGFSDSYYHRHNSSDMVTYIKPNYATDNEAYHQQILREYVEKEDKLKVSGYAYINVNEPISLSLNYGAVSVAAQGIEAMEAKNVPLDSATAEERLKKTGDTDFVFESIDSFVGDNVFVPNGALNKLRRDAFELLEAELHKKDRRSFDQGLEYSFSEADAYKDEKCLFSASVETEEQLVEVLSTEYINKVYIPVEMCNDTNIRKIKAHGKSVYVSLPIICRSRSVQRVKRALEFMELDGALVKNYEELWLVKALRPDMEIVSDHNLYTYNDYAKDSFCKAGAKVDTVPYELNMNEIRNRNNANSEMVIYGYYPLMVTANCVHKNTGRCDQVPQLTKMIDRYKKTFVAKNYCLDCYNVIYNSLPTFLNNNMENIKNIGVERFRISFTIEKGDKVRHILDIIDNKSRPFENEEFTNGHFKRGVE